MMQRLREVLRRGSSAARPQRQYRPNELRVDVVRAERLRRDARRAEPAARNSGRSLEEFQSQRSREPAPAPAIQPGLVRRQIATLKTRSGLRQAWLQKEILGPPLALRHQFHEDNDR
jgi:hypothetical protein